jgi:outer membrane immunogenic protein
MIRRILLASAGAIALAGTAYAADLTPHPPPVMLPPLPMWTGFYIGLNAGGTWSGNNNANIASVPVLADSTGVVSGLAVLANSNVPLSSASGFIGGGQIGYNYQLPSSWLVSSWLVGIEADIDGVAGAHVNGNVASVGTFPPAITMPFDTALSATKSLDYLGTVRGRFGFLWTPTLLIFGDGGLAYGGVKTNVDIFQAAPTNGFIGAGVSNSVSNTKVGWTAGGGVEWMFLPNWSAKVEYLYYDLGTVTTATLLNAVVPVAPVAGIYALTHTSTRFNGNVVRAGINYHFNWGAPAPVVAKY